MLPFNFSSCRAQFPALKREIGGQPVVYFDGPAGSQVPLQVADAVRDYLLHHNANSHGLFATSRETDALVDRARGALADFLGASDPSSIVFGGNMTSLTFAFSRALARTWQAGDEIIVTRLDHDANVTPWRLAARDAGVTLHYAGLRPEDGTLDVDALLDLLSPRTRLVAVGCASNATGSVNPVAEITAAAHAAGAEVYLDAVHYAPHGLIDVDTWGCDYLACSAYKFFGPHVGVLYGRPERLAELEPYKLRPAPATGPDKWMTGTQSFELIAGAAAAIDYLADLGAKLSPGCTTRRAKLQAAMRGISTYERTLGEQMLAGLLALPSVKVWGIADTARSAQRVPTFAITHARLSPAELASRLAERGIFVWSGNYYALEFTETMNLEPEGMVRIGLLHYNTSDEVARLLAELAKLEQ